MKLSLAVGMKLGRLTVLEKICMPKGIRARWKCSCECGSIIEADGANLGRSKFSCGCLKSPPMIGRRFGILTVVDQAPNQGTRMAWKCRCDCGGEKRVAGPYLRRGSVTSCGCLLKLKGPKCARWEGVGDISASRWHRYRHGATQRELEFNITIEYMWELFLKQNRRCALSGVELCFPEAHGEYPREESTASLDRIDPKKGYFEGNVQWVHRVLNHWKGGVTQEGFIRLCNRVASLHPRSPNDCADVWV